MMAAEHEPGFGEETLVGGPETSDASESPRVGPPIASGDQIGRYRVRERIGAGAMGEVWVAYDPELDRRIAVKLLLPRGRDRSESRLRLLREAQALARIAHPNVVTVHDVGEHRGRVFLAMEFIDGGTVRAWLKGAAKGRSWREIISVFADAARGLAAIHATGLVHRDVKPDNLMLGTDGRVRVMDLGLARVDEQRYSEPSSTTRLRGSDTGTLDSVELSASVTQTGSVLGTPAYMAPEQFSPQLGSIDARADQFAFCVTLFEALWGRRPFRGNDVASVAFSILHEDPQLPADRRRTPSWLERAVLRGLARDPARRWPSMDALAELLSHEVGRRRRRTSLIVAGFAVVGALGLGLWLSGDDHETQCTGSEQQIAAVWGPTQRERVHAAFAATGLGYAERSAEQTVAALDDYAAQWAEAQREACLDTRVRGFASQAILDARARCLAERRRELGSLVEVLVDADGEIVEHAGEAVSALPRIEPCTDADAVLTRDASTPDDPALAGEVEHLREELSHARSLYTTGKITAGLALLDDIAAAVEAADYRPLTAEYTYLRGQLVDDEGEIEQGVQLLRRAYMLAEREGLDALARDVASTLGYDMGDGLADPDEAELWLDIADAKLERAPDPLAAAQLALHHGRVAGKAARFDEALADYARARELLEHIYGPDHPQVARALNGTSWVLQERHEYEASLAIQTDVIERLEAGLGPDHPAVASAHSTLGGTLFQLGRPAEALPHFEAAARIYARSNPEHPDRAVNMANAALCKAELGEVHEALALLEQALALELETLGPEHSNVVAARVQRGHMLSGIGRYTEALEELEQALAAVEHSYGAEHPHAAVCLNNIGRNDINLGQFDQARAALERAMAIRVAAFGEGHASLANTWYLLGILERLKGHPEAARDALARAWETSGEDGLRGAMYALAELRLGERDHARELIQDAVQKIGEDEASLRAATLLAAAEIDRAFGDEQGARARVEEVERLLASNAAGADPRARARTLVAMLNRLWDFGLVDAARPYEARALAAFEAAGDEVDAADLRRLMTNTYRQ
jgi:tetratricopeptide (TPR) repeat protein